MSWKKIENKVLLEIINDCGLESEIAEKFLEQNVGNDGCKLSGGQKQKIALARAIVKDAPIFIFDEITSNIDLMSEMQINRLLKGKLKNKTVIMATHKTSILKDIDKIVIISEGGIKTQGTYTELLEHNSNFKNIIETKENM